MKTYPEWACCDFHFRGGHPGQPCSNPEVLERQPSKRFTMIATDKRHAYVLGSNKKDNIGHDIARTLRLAGFRSVTESNDRSGHEYGGMDTLILANGLAEMDWIPDLDGVRADRVISSTLTQSIIQTQKFVQDTIADARYRKCIIFIGSMAHSKVLSGQSLYCAAKAGLAHYARCAAFELAPRGYDVYIVHPAQVGNTPMEEKNIEELMRLRGLSREAAWEHWTAGIVRPMALPNDVSNLVVDLALGRCPHLSGTQIEMSGGAR